jgi:hypothetical protein
MSVSMLNTHMRFSHFSSNQQKYKVTVRIIDGSQSMTVDLTLEVNGIYQARLVASKLFGSNNVVSVIAILNEFIESTQTLTADQLKIKSLKDEQKKYAELAKREKARQSLDKAQKNYRKEHSQ